MKLNRLFVAAAAALVPAAMASAYSLSISKPATLPAPPAAAGSATLTISLAGAQGESILSASLLNQVQGIGGGTAPAGLTLTGGSGTAAGLIFASFQDPGGSGNLSTQAASNPDAPDNHYRFRSIFVPVNDSGAPVPQTLVDGNLATVVINWPAGLPKGDYPIVFVGTSGTDTFISDANNNPILASGAAGTTLTVLPEPASALLLLGALPFLRRRTA